MRIARAVLLVVCSILFSTNPMVIAEDASSHKGQIAAIESVEMSLETSLKAGELGGLTGVVDLGRLKPNIQLRAKITVVNPTGSDIAFDSVSEHCQCTKLIPKSGVIPPGKALEFELRFDVRPVSGLTQNTAGFIASQSGIEVFRVTLTYQYGGVVSFRPRMVMTSVARGQGQASFMVPWVQDSALPNQSVEITWSDSLEAVRNQVDFDMKYLRCTINEDALQKGPLRGHVTISNLETGYSDRIPVVIDLASPISVFPHFLRFTRKSVDKPMLLSDEEPRSQATLIVSYAVADPESQLTGTASLPKEKAGLSVRAYFSKSKEEIPLTELERNGSFLRFRIEEKLATLHQARENSDEIVIVATKDTHVYEERRSFSISNAQY